MPLSISPQTFILSLCRPKGVAGYVRYGNAEGIASFVLIKPPDLVFVMRQIAALMKLKGEEESDHDNQHACDCLTGCFEKVHLHFPYKKDAG